MAETELEYVGFWARVWAALIDSVLLMVVTVPLLIAVYGWSYLHQSTGGVDGLVDFLLSWILPIVAVILFWVKRQATPGKMAISAQIVDAVTGKKPSTKQLIIRYVGYFVSTIPFGLGLFWVAFDPKKQGWHDKLAGTVVVRPKKRGAQPVSFDAS